MVAAAVWTAAANWTEQRSPAAEAVLMAQPAWAQPRATQEQRELRALRPDSSPDSSLDSNLDCFRERRQVRGLRRELRDAEA